MFWVRLRSSIILIVLALVTMFAGGYVLLAAMVFLSLMAYRELAGAAGVSAGKKSGKKNGLEIVGIIGIIFYYLLLSLSMETEVIPVETAILFTLICVFMGGMFVYVFGFPKFQASQVMAAFFGFFYGPVCLSFIYLTREFGRGAAGDKAETGLFIVWLILIASWGCDTCAYCVGMLIGRHKMSPVLSPKKSVEGAVGGVVGAAALGALYGFFVREMVADERIVLFFALICGVGSLISMVGDLAASAVKRNAGIKDYGKLIPGHGGVIDRFDSVIFTAPVIYFMAVFLLG
ncbi:phosphatidate cytidylyltransferase [bacterium 1XD8-76]|nr:phosphatidate cytidylyltransferase [bacterium 1XD8-76]